MRGPLGPHFEQNWVPMALGSSATVACAHLVFYHFNPLVCQFHNHNGSCSASSSAEGTLLRTQRVGQFFQYNHRFGFQRPMKLKVGKWGWWDQPLLTRGEGGPAKTRPLLTSKQKFSDSKVLLLSLQVPLLQSSSYCLPMRPHHIFW